MRDEDTIFLRDFFRAATDRPLDPDDPRYVNLHDDPELSPDDPVELIARAIEWSPGQTVQLLSGFRGTGKSTELRRLRKRLRDSGYIVVLFDIEDYLSVSTPIDVSDFLMATAGAFGDTVASDGLLPRQGSAQGYWSRLATFIKSLKIDDAELTGELSLPGAAVNLKLNLKSDPAFRKRVQERMAGFLGALVGDIRAYVRETVSALRIEHPEALGVVLLADSIEHIRGTSANADDVQASVENLFAAHAEQLQLPDMHVVYTVPPYLKVRYPLLGALYAPGGVQVLQPLKVHQRETRDPYKAGVDALERVVRARGDWERLLGSRDKLDKLILLSGGHLRDLLYVLTEIVRRAESLPVDDLTISRGVSQVKSEFLPISNEDLAWLGRIAATGQAALQTIVHLTQFARFLDTHLVLCYRNGSDWYDANPMILDELTPPVE
jgi:hypothetical protein